MKKIIALVLFVGLTYTTNAQVETPQPSPFSKVEQKVGLTDVTIEYSRPGVKGRAIFGDLVPFGKTWRTGANANTKITFSNDVTIGETTLKAGTYAIYTIPNKESWDVLFYTDSENWGTPRKWDESKVAAKVAAQVHEVPFNVESFTIDINNLQSDSATLEMIWEKTFIAVPFSVPTDEVASASIEKTMAGPSINDYFSSAKYYFDSGKDLNKAKKWIDSAVSTSEEPAFWHIRLQSLIYAKLGDKKGAIKAAKRSLELATEAGNADYVKMNKESIAEWAK
ncbi:MAG: dihydrolipoamide dehydrogenase [Lutibacter sp.]|nr:MAG: dihydrolipoamide dehydrogenase [Lutibacter sp.]